MLLPADSPLRLTIFSELHSSPHGGHSGYQATLSRVKLSFHWPNIHKDIRLWVQACPTCQQCKPSNTKLPGLLQPLPIPHQAWDDISLDFITSLPSSHGKSAILVVADRLTKYAHFFGLRPHYTASSVADVFLSGVFKLHGFPRSIVSDRDPLFLSHFWKEFFAKQGTKLQFSSAYHPQSDGQTEVINRCLQQYLRCFVHEQPSRWFLLLPMAEYWYNTSYHSALKMTPFEALYHRAPPSLLLHSFTDSSAPSTDHAALLRQLRANLLSAQQRMKFQADKHRSELEFQVGDLVLVRLRQYRQLSVASSHHKLQKKFYGPYKIIEKISPVAYRLLLPSSSRIHNTFHVSLLRPFIGSDALPSDFPPPPLPVELSSPPPDSTSILQEKNLLGKGGVDTDQPMNASEPPSNSKADRRRKRPNYLDDFYLHFD